MEDLTPLHSSDHWTTEGKDISVQRNNIEKNPDVSFDYLALLAWVPYLRS